jgi:malate dehydrogenase (oxaloacetate-decarboxylating)
LNDFKKEIAECTNPKNIKGELEKVLDKADVFIGVSSANSFKKEWIKKMNTKSIIFALANPNPEISEKDAIDGGAEIYASGRSD